MPDYSSVYERRRLDFVAELIPEGSGLAVDVGCNEGVTTGLLARAGYSAVGLDVDEEAIRRGQSTRPHLDLRAASLHNAGLSGAALVLCLEVLEHLDATSQRLLLADVRKSLRPGGIVIMSTPGRWSALSMYERLRRGPMWWRFYDWWDPTHLRVLSFRAFRRLLRDAGFRIERFVGFGYPPHRFRHTAIRRGPFKRAGFDMVVVATRIG